MERDEAAMRKRLAELAARPGCADPVHINVWRDDEGDPVAEPGRQVAIDYRGADGRKSYRPKKRREKA